VSFAIVFSGQGTQHPLMLPWLAEDALVRNTCALLGVVDWRERLQDRAWAISNANAQVLLTGLSLAAWQQIADALPAPACVAGYSVGELAAFSAAGVFDGERALEFARQRAQAMDRCAQQAPGGLLAVSGATRTALEALRVYSGAAVAISNGVDSVVLGGPDAVLERAEHWAAARGVRTTRLEVAIASHTPWMRDAAEDFARALATQTLQGPGLPLFSNAADRIHDAAQAARALAAQIATSVRWDECMENINARAPHCVLEIGPGQALARMWNQRYPAIPARSCDDFRSKSALIEWLAGPGSG
jgi:[acyl-carrier-protein] S-malonyltransferase